MQFRVVVVLGLAALCSVSCSNSKTGSQATTETADSTAAMTPVQRGAYLTTVVGCHDCHTPGAFYGAPDMNRQLSGSELGWQGPWGVSYARNLTPDKTTGIGDWTDDEILNAMQKGVKKDGSPIAPPMPWPDFARLTHADAMAIVAYLRSIPPITHQMPPRVAPGGHVGGSIITIPPPSEWDKPRG